MFGSLSGKAVSEVPDIYRKASRFCSYGIDDDAHGYDLWRWIAKIPRHEARNLL